MTAALSDRTYKLSGAGVGAESVIGYRFVKADVLRIA
jgi:hypothetical protein